MKDIVRDWLGSHEEQITLFEVDDEIILKRQDNLVLLSVQLTSTPSDTTTLQSWLRLGVASLNLFQGALAQKADSGTLWLIQTLRSGQGKPTCSVVLKTCSTSATRGGPRQRDSLTQPAISDPPRYVRCRTNQRILYENHDPQAP